MLPAFPVLHPGPIPACFCFPVPARLRRRCRLPRSLSDREGVVAAARDARSAGRLDQHVELPSGDGRLLQGGRLGYRARDPGGRSEGPAQAGHGRSPGHGGGEAGQVAEGRLSGKDSYM